MGKLIPLILVLAALSGGVGAGILLKPDAEPEACADGDEECLATEEAAEDAAKMTAETPSEFAELNRQFVVPLVQGGRVQALVVCSIAVEVVEGATEAVFAAEPKLRDAFLNVLFVHAHSGGFEGNFTSGVAMADLKTRLREAAERILGKNLRDVLITEIVRQDL